MMKSIKNNWITLLTLLLVFLQPMVSFGNVSSFSAEIINTQEEIALFKTKSSKALIFKEISIFSVELVNSNSFAGKNLIYPSYLSSNPESFLFETRYLIDFRGVLATQIFPFHFFL